MADLDEMKAELEKMRDELKLKMHLAGMELQQAYKRIKNAI